MRGTRVQAGLDASFGRGIMPDMDQPLDSEKDIPLREDIRLLGRILGETVRNQEGDAFFDIIEGIRQRSIRFRRDEDQVARRELEAALNRLSRDETIQIIRAYVQIELLKRHRAGDADERVVQGIHLTINGIAAGLRNSG